jgi:type IV pilus assembly protein PilE
VRRGFTLIELMVVIIVAAILVGIAVPSYMAQTRKSRRTDAKTALLDLAGREERYNSTNSVYTSVPGDLGYAGQWPAKVGGGYYQISVCVNAAVANCPEADTGTGATFVLTAQPVPGSTQAEDTQCGSFTLDNTGLQKVTGTSPPSDCW